MYSQIIDESGIEMGDSEHDISENVAKVMANSSKTSSEVKDNEAKIQKLNVDSLKKLEEMMQSAEKDLAKLERKILRSGALVSESKSRLHHEIATTRAQVKERYIEMKSRIAKSITPG